MKNNQHAGLKKKSVENQQRCFEMLVSAKAMHEDAVIFDATLNDEGEIELGVFTFDDEPQLQKRAGILLDQPHIRELVAGAKGGTLVSVLTDKEDMPSWVQTHGIPIPNDDNMGGNADNSERSIEQSFDEYCQYASTRNVPAEYRRAITAHFGCGTLTGPITTVEDGIEYFFDFQDENTGHFFKIFSGRQLTEYAKYLACPKHLLIFRKAKGIGYGKVGA